MYCRPYRFKVIDDARAIVQFAARNPGYTRLVIEAAAWSDDDEGAAE
jgi:hypothetical protein